MALTEIQMLRKRKNEEKNGNNELIKVTGSNLSKFLSPNRT